MEDQERIIRLEEKTEDLNQKISLLIQVVELQQETITELKSEMCIPTKKAFK